MAAKQSLDQKGVADRMANAGRVMDHYGLDRNSRENVQAAIAYVWTRSGGAKSDLGFSEKQWPDDDKSNHAAAEAVLKYELEHPNTLGVATREGADGEKARAALRGVISDALGNAGQTGETGKKKPGETAAPEPQLPYVTAPPEGLEDLPPDGWTKDGQAYWRQDTIDNALKKRSVGGDGPVGANEASGEAVKEGRAPTTELRTVKITSPDNVQATEPQKKKNPDGEDVMNWQLFDKESGAVFSDVDANIMDPANPGTPDQDLSPKQATTPGGEKVKLELTPEVKAGGHNFTKLSLEKNKEVWEKTFARPLENYGGSIEQENLANFQFEYDKLRKEHDDWTPQQLGDEAIRRVSFGKARIAIGFSDLKVEMTVFRRVEIRSGPYKGHVADEVPTVVKVFAKKPPAPNN